MVFCGQCGYQLSPGDKVCPRCGSATDVDIIEQDPGTYNPTEISHAILELSPQNRASQPEQAGPLVLGSGGGNVPGANDATATMNSQMWAPQPPYPGYPQQAGTGIYGYNAGGYPQYQVGQAQVAAVTQLIEASRKGKIASLLLILFGLLMLVGAIIVFLLAQ